MLRTEKRVVQTLRAPQIQALVAYRRQSIPTRRIHLLALTVLGTGLRIDEALKLGWADVDFENLLGSPGVHHGVQLLREFRLALAVVADAPVVGRLIPVLAGLLGPG